MHDTWILGTHCRFWEKGNAWQIHCEKLMKVLQ